MEGLLSIFFLVSKMYEVLLRHLGKKKQERKEENSQPERPGLSERTRPGPGCACARLPTACKVG